MKQIKRTTSAVGLMVVLGWASSCGSPARVDTPLPAKRGSEADAVPDDDEDESESESESESFVNDEALEEPTEGEAALDDVERPLPSSTDVEALIEKDWSKLSASEREGVRYISIAHLTGRPRSELETVTFGIEKALNSVSFAKSMRKLAPLDPARSTFKLSLADFGWRADTWTLIERGEHGVTNVTRLPSGATLAKGDWLVFALTRPEVYDRLLKIPALENMLERRLGVDRSRAVYMGVRSSIVTSTGRILERIPISHDGEEGYYWRSYDFLFQGAADRALATADPTYANGRSVTDLIAGEFIFSLPNGLQGYMLSGFGAQHRYDAQASVAHDDRREDKLVINGESCIACHANGLNTRKDEVRPAFENNAAMDPTTKARLRRLYPEQDDLDRLFATDNARFAAAIAELGYKLGREPISATIEVFKADRGVRDFREQRGEVDAVFGR